MCLLRPTKQLIEKYVSDFMERQAGPENAIRFLVDSFPDNQSYEGVLLKSIAINAIYNTQIIAIADMVAHIISLNIDEDLYCGLPGVIERIARFKQRNNYSFATKYCSFHKSDAYPIYDSYVDKLLVAYQKQDEFTSFRRAELKNYVRFKQILDEFKNFYCLDNVSLKHLDNFLYGYGRERFGKFSLRAA